MSYAITGTTNVGFAEAVDAIKASLAEQGFGVLTEIDMTATLKQKIDADIAPYTILGACRPVFAEQSVRVEPQIGLLLPCNVVVRELDGGVIEVSAIDPDVMVEMTGNQQMAELAAEARTRLSAAVAAVTQ